MSLYIRGSARLLPSTEPKYDVSASGHGWFKRWLKDEFVILWRRYYYVFHSMTSESSVKFQSENQLLYLLSEAALPLSYSGRNLTISILPLFNPFDSTGSSHMFEMSSSKTAFTKVCHRIAWFCIAGSRLQVQVQLIRGKNTQTKHIFQIDFYLQDLSNVLCMSC